MEKSFEVGDDSAGGLIIAVPPAGKSNFGKADGFSNARQFSPENWRRIQNPKLKVKYKFTRKIFYKLISSRIKTFLPENCKVLYFMRKTARFQGWRGSH